MMPVEDFVVHNNLLIFMMVTLPFPLKKISRNSVGYLPRQLPFLFFCFFFPQIYDIFLMEWIFSIEIEFLFFFFLIERINVNSALTE